MLYYLLKRVLAAIPILIGVNLITFALFFMVNSPDDIARVHLGEKYVTSEAIHNWKHMHGYDHPLFYDAQQPSWQKLTQTLFFQKSLKLFLLQFGRADDGRDIGFDIQQRMWPSLAIAVPVLLIGLGINITVALLLIFFRRTYLNFYGLLLCILLTSISMLFYIIAGQYLFAKIFLWVPISGYAPGWQALKFVLLPIALGILSTIGAEVRWYRTIFLEEINKDYVRTAYAKGLSETRILFVHVLKNAMIPILTGIVVVIPFLFMGSLILESFFGIPGLGSYTIDAIAQQDFSIVRAMVFLGTIFYILSLILTDISYTLVDPRIRL